MNEAALYALEHIDKTMEIHDAISDMEELVFKGFDSAVKKSISDWFGDNWQCDESENLMDGAIYLYTKRVGICTFASEKSMAAPRRAGLGRDIQNRQ